jgi:hypothetical protein
VLIAALFAFWLPTFGPSAFDMDDSRRQRREGAENVSWRLLSPASWFGGRSHLGTGKVYVRFDRSRLAKGVLFLDDVDLKLSATGIIVRDPGVISLRSAVPGVFHDWHPTEYCKVVVHANEITVLDVLVNGKTERTDDGTLVSRPVCKCMIPAVRDKPSDANEAPTCE